MTCTKCKGVIDVVTDECRSCFGTDKDSDEWDDRCVTCHGRGDVDYHECDCPPEVEA